MTKWFVEYYDEEGFWYLDGGFDSLTTAQNYYDNVKQTGYELVRFIEDEIR